MNRIKALYRSRAIACAGADVYKPQRREQWLAKLPGPGARARAEIIPREGTLTTKEIARAFENFVGKGGPGGRS
jgi:hypothetical protein